MRNVLLAGPSGSDPAGRRAVYDALRSALPDRDIVDVARAGGASNLLGPARRSGGIVMAGVTLTAGESPAGSPAGSARSIAALAALSSAARRPLAAIGVSTGPLEGRLPRMLAGRAVRRSDLLLLGDEESAGHLAAAGAPLPMRVSADPAWAVMSPPSGPAGTGESVLVALDGRLGSEVEADLAAALESVVQAGHPVRLLPWAGSGSGDGAMGWRLARRLREAGAAPVAVETVPGGLTDAAERMAGARLVVALRYRALHAAASAGVPVVGVAVEARLSALAARLNQTVVTPAELAWVLPSLLAGPAALRPADPARVGAEIHRAQAGLGLLRLLLDPTEVPADELNLLPLFPVPWL